MKTGEHFRKNLTQFLVSHGLNPTEFAKRAGIPRPTVQKLLNGSTENPRNITLTTIASFFNVSIEDLLFGETTNTVRRQVSFVPLLKRSEIEAWLKNISPREKVLSTASILATPRKISEKAFAISCNETGSAIFKSGSNLIFDPVIKPSDDSYVLIKLFDHDELLFRQISVDVGVIFIKQISAQFNSASKVRANDKIIATLIQVQTNFEEI